MKKKKCALCHKTYIRQDQEWKVEIERAICLSCQIKAKSGRFMLQAIFGEKVEGIKKGINNENQ